MAKNNVYKAMFAHSWCIYFEIGIDPVMMTVMEFNEFELARSAYKLQNDKFNECIYYFEMKDLLTPQYLATFKDVMMKRNDVLNKCNRLTSRDFEKHKKQLIPLTTDVAKMYKLSSKQFDSSVKKLEKLRDILMVSIAYTDGDKYFEDFINIHRVTVNYIYMLIQDPIKGNRTGSLTLDYKNQARRFSASLNVESGEVPIEGPVVFNLQDDSIEIIGLDRQMEKAKSDRNGNMNGYYMYWRLKPRDDEPL